ncbi:hypothetical protein BOW49_12675 [Solemya velum gill symbiont]|uniref:TetR/AcrR family transcriptional regulator n=1 Tax=Solemya velum gill symbiont TaxID=2340 RepID=UPI0009D41DB1|nr:TetR/AcrR family transcriptional regulator [Solemya velum gill symbiont]OOZ71404.1 hypothetical protein BOW49_12675 [Solemya velum gill symbiont]
MGRPAQYQRDEVLEKAMEAFWDGGYTATSMAQLVKATNLKPGSLYSAFKSKEDLFFAVLGYYAEHNNLRFKEALSENESPLDAIRSFFNLFANMITDPESRRGCLLINTILELARKDDDVRERVTKYLDANEELFRQALVSAQEKGELSSDRDPGAIAAFLMTNIWGLRVLAGTAPEKERTQAIVDQLLMILD